MGTRANSVGFSPAAARRRSGLLPSVPLLCGLALLACAPGALQAASTTEGQAVSAVRGWLRQEACPLGARFGGAVGRTLTVREQAGGTLYYVVHLQPAGFVVLAPDDRLEPIVAFSPAGTFDQDPRNPLVAALAEDLPVRLSHAAQVQGAARAAGKWKRLLDVAALPAGSVETSASSVSDPRVDPLTQTTWDQRNVAGAACYNYYTPPNAEGDTGNYYCGCVATAAAQLMRFWQYPTAGVGTASFSITVSGTGTTRHLRGGDVAGTGAAYNWGQMVLSPDSSMITAQRQAIGALTADAGVSVNMDYGSSGSSSDTLQMQVALTSTFGYAHARAGYNGGSDLGSVRNKMVNPNLDAGFPVLLGITGTPGGHAVVCDGYGYNGSTLYHHLNLGWSGNSTAWYNLPTIDTGGGTFTSNYKCVYNVYPSGTGEIISGRITDTNSAVIAGATVSAARSGGGTYTATSSSRGIYALAKIPSGSSYTVSVTKAGYVFNDQSLSTGTSQNSSTTCGNIWAADFQGTAGNWQSESVNWRVDYGNNWNATGYVSKPGATAIRVHFSTISVESGHDHLRTNASDDWSGSYSSVTSSAIFGNTLSLSVTSDSSVTGYFIIDRVDFTGVLLTGPATNSGAVFAPLTAAAVKGDMNGDGKPDLILQNYAAGTLQVWPLNGSGGYSSPLTLTAGGAEVQMGANSGGWTLAGCADFNNDGKQDLVFQDIANGHVQIWFMDRLAVTNQAPVIDTNNAMLNLGASSGGWQVTACGDLTGDGRPDMLLQDLGTGALSVWTLNGPVYLGSSSLTDRSGVQVSLGANSGGWALVGCADFNGDGKNDILWQNYAAGQTSVWMMDRTVYTGSAALADSAGHAMNLGNNSGGWIVTGCGDYNGDGKADLVWQQPAQGSVSLWLMNRTTYTGSVLVRSGVGSPLTLGANSGGWSVAGCGDINGNGKAEIFWQHTALGSLSAWATSGYNYAGSMSILDSGGHAMGLGTNSAGWRAIGFADFNGDGKPDLLMQNDAQGLVCVWFLNGNKFVSGGMITSSNGQALSLGTNSGGWRVVGAADYNGDGKPDLILQNDAQGILNIWTLNGTVFTGGYYITDSSNHIMSLGTNSSGWRAAGCSDFNGDGKNDIVMQNDALGLLTVWFLNGSKFLSSGILKDTSGNTMNMGTDSAGWRIRGCGDINGDGKKEVLWQHQATGYTSMWILNGLTYLGGGMILDPTGAVVNLGSNSNGWQIVAPR